LEKTHVRPKAIMFHVAKARRWNIKKVIPNATKKAGDGNASINDEKIRNKNTAATGSENTCKN